MTATGAERVPARDYSQTGHAAASDIKRGLAAAGYTDMPRNAVRGPTQPGKSPALSRRFARDGSPPRVCLRVRERLSKFCNP